MGISRSPDDDEVEPGVVLRESIKWKMARRKKEIFTFVKDTAELKQSDTQRNNKLEGQIDSS